MSSACDNPNTTATLISVIADTLQVFALTGTPPSYPAAFLASSGAVTRADGSFNFDVAFDISPSNEVVVYPQKLVGVPCVAGAVNCGGAAGGKPVGLQRITVAFDSLERAPAAGYQFDSTFALTPGQALVMQVQSSSECPLSFSTVMYTKFVDRQHRYRTASHLLPIGQRSELRLSQPRSRRDAEELISSDARSQIAA